LDVAGSLTSQRLEDDPQAAARRPSHVLPPSVSYFVLFQGLETKEEITYQLLALILSMGFVETNHRVSYVKQGFKYRWEPAGKPR
jgi:hypothetical protein